MPSSPVSPNRMESSLFADAAKKRRKGATRLSCAECRRLKLRCDRGVPCGSCVKRGCGAICPDGSLTTGQGNRFVLASTQELHEKISELSNRVRELEDGLRVSHSYVANDMHPLLTEELLQIKAPLQREPPSNRNIVKGETKEEEQNGEVVDAFGSLSISATGGAKYYGSIANSWYFLQNEVAEGQETDGDRLAALQNILPPEILARSGAFPILPTTHPSIEIENVRLRSLFWYLPPNERAHELSEIYYCHGAWMYNPINKESFYEDIYPQFYSPDVGPPADDPHISHRLALMFMVLAIGSLMDTRQPAYNIEAEKYHQLARAAIFQSSLFDDPTIHAVQTLFLMTFYYFMSDRHGSNSGARWAIMGMAIKVAQSIGLHRDSGRWGVDSKETLRRRELFWELYTYDSWQCLTFGRPPSFYLAHVDCKLPYATDAPDEFAFHSWKHRFTSECMSIVHDQAFGAKTPTYATVLQLDRKLRAFPVPPILQVAGFGNSEPRPGGFPESIMLTLQRHIVLAIREMDLLYLHRSFFARAVTDHPKDPLGSPYGTSVIAAYRSAGSLVALMRNLYTQYKEPTERIWFLWTHMFSCAIVLGSVVTRCPSMSLAPSALVQLDSACELFSKAAHGFRAHSVLEIMVGLQTKAHISLSEFRKGKVSPLQSRQMSLSEPLSPYEEDDELSTLGGKTRLVAKKDSLSPSPQVMERSPTSLNPVVPLPLTAGTNHPVHPYVVDYLRTFGPTPIPVHNAGPSYTDASAFSVSPVREHSQYIDTSSGYHQEMQSPIQPMELVAGQFPSYFSVYDYGVGGDNGYSHMNGHSMSGQRRESPEANTIHTTWQDFVNGIQ
ncbi:fungal-specific transcription factor domain-containing protein [Hygrophoropsis aurantiaca]|uniref:Fungal-specific transcription factor domain-containing protein n=1 Tax=Hygrophoropsis aurantiaca TaxID=72124 RepID=A0ACB8AMZ1_9AGAM|nr:fungal-specific transcription factor domain-containing protein [Hygrophoropsis aurantiaca]